MGLSKIKRAQQKAARLAREKPAYDFTFRNEGSIVILTAHTQAARDWVDAHLPEDRQTWGPAGTVVEWRYFPAILQGIHDDGLTIKEL